MKMLMQTKTTAEEFKLASFQITWSSPERSKRTPPDCPHLVLTSPTVAIILFSIFTSLLRTQVSFSIIHVVSCQGV